MRLYFRQLLQAPFYNYQADEAVNYGGIELFGHAEISHGLMTQVLVTMQMEI
jgi:predicted metalloendopeptidase